MAFVHFWIKIYILTYLKCLRIAFTQLNNGTTFMHLLTCGYSYSLAKTEKTVFRDQSQVCKWTWNEYSWNMLKTESCRTVFVDNGATNDGTTSTSKSVMQRTENHLRSGAIDGRYCLGHVGTGGCPNSGMRQTFRQKDNFIAQKTPLQVWGVAVI